MAEPVQAPTRRPRQGGIKTVAGEFVPVNRLAIVNGAGGLAWEDSGCGLPKVTRAGCYDDVIAAADKTFDGVTRRTSIGDPFARYAGVECWLGGDDDGSYLEQASTLLEQGEDRAVESALWAWAAAAATPGTATSWAQGIALAEDVADANYVGAPVILMSRFAAEQAYAAGAITREDGRLVTGNGNWVLSTGAGPDGERNRILAVGALAVYASTEVRASVTQHTDNLAAAIAERLYAVGVDCDYRYAVNVTIA
jgi:hypothetical protein